MPADQAPGNSCYVIPDRCRIAVAGDWGSGTDEALAVMTQMMTNEQGHGVDLTIHLGDVYYVGDTQEIEENCNGANTDEYSGVLWRAGALGSFALCGNHEMLARGGAYYSDFLPKLGMPANAGQVCSFFKLENAHWRIIAIDTGFNSVISLIPPMFNPDCRLDDALIDWLRNTVNPKARPKATVILSHHQYFSAFEKNYPAPATQLSEFFDQPLLWLWGHEHRLAGYGQYGIGPLKVHGRCVGNGGMPVEAIKPPQDDGDDGAKEHLLFYDRRSNVIYPPAEDGVAVGLNGFAQISLDADTLAITYKTLVPLPGANDPNNPQYEAVAQTIFRESFISHPDGSIEGPAIDTSAVLNDPDFYFNRPIGGELAQSGAP